MQSVNIDYMGLEVEASVISGDTCATDKGTIYYAPYIDELAVTCEGNDITPLLSDNALEMLAELAIEAAREISV